VNEDLRFFAGLLAVVALVAAGAMALSAVGSQESCHQRWGEMHHEWSLLGGCRVLTEDGYVPESNLRIQFDGTKVIVSD
jgi:hypothetical protein